MHTARGPPCESRQTARGVRLVAAIVGDGGFDVFPASVSVSHCSVPAGMSRDVPVENSSSGRDASEPFSFGSAGTFVN